MDRAMFGRFYFFLLFENTTTLTWHFGNLRSILWNLNTRLVHTVKFRRTQTKRDLPLSRLSAVSLLSTRALFTNDYLNTQNSGCFTLSATSIFTLTKTSARRLVRWIIQLLKVSFDEISTESWTLQRFN